jgi:hypothetical protein
MRSYENALYRQSFASRFVNNYLPFLFVKHERERNFASTFENWLESLDGTGITHAVCAPISPNSTYSDMTEVRKRDSRALPFTSPDFTAENTIEKLTAEVEGSFGVKIHPIIQEIEADSKRMMEVVDSVSAAKRPILLHAGRARYYLKREGRERFIDNSSADKLHRLIATFPDQRFIIGHAGLDEVRYVLDELPKYRNVYVDTSFQPPETIRLLIKAFGGQRVLFASDWPYGIRKPAITAMEQACKGDSLLQRAVFYENAMELFNLTN